MKLRELNRKLVSNKNELIKHKNDMIMKEEKLALDMHYLGIKIQRLNSRMKFYSENKYQVSERIACINGHLNTAQRIKL